MKAVVTVAGRELLRNLKRPLGYGVAIIFYLVQFAIFSIYLTQQAGDEPFTVAPTSWLYSGGLLLFVMAIFIPSMTMRSYAEERVQGTWDSLGTLGLGVTNIVLGKFLANVVMFSLWMLALMVIPISWGVFAYIDWYVLIYSVGFVVLVAAHLIALSIWLTCRSSSIMAAYIIAGVVLMMYSFFYVFQSILPDEFYRPFFNTFNINLAMEYSSKGLVGSVDLVFYVSSTILFIVLTINRLEAEKIKSTNTLRVKRFIFCLGSVFVVYLLMYIAHRDPKQWNASNRGLSSEFEKIVKAAPDGMKVYAIFPKMAKKQKYIEAMNLINTFLDHIKSINPNIELKRLDPDKNISQVSRMKNYTLLKNSNLGGLIIEYKQRVMAIPYFRLVAIDKVTRANKPVYYIKALLAEQEVAKAFVNLGRKGPAPKVLVMEGYSELNLRDEALTGGSKFTAMMGQMGFMADTIRPGIDPLPDLKNYAMALILDPKRPVGKAGKDLVYKLMKEGVPVLAAKGIHDQIEGGSNKNLFKPYGVKTANKVIAQKQYNFFDTFTVPITQFSTHPISNGLVHEGNRLVFSNADILLDTVAADPNLIGKPLLQIADSPLIWGEADLSTMMSGQLKPRDEEDLEPPFIVGKAIERQSKLEKQPLLVLFSSRSIFENRFIDSGAHRVLLYKSIDWLVHQSHTVQLPPSRVVDYSLDFSPSELRNYQFFLMLGMPFLLLIMAIRVYLKSR